MGCRKEIASTFAALAKQHGGSLRREQAMELLSSINGSDHCQEEAADQLWEEMRLGQDDHITEVAPFPPSICHCNMKRSSSCGRRRCWVRMMECQNPPPPPETPLQ